MEEITREKAVVYRDFWTRESWLYLAVVMDLYSKRIVGWAISNRMKKDLAIRALDMAIALRNHQSRDDLEEYLSHTKTSTYSPVQIYQWVL